ncbi:succinylglutamate desuccinylase [Aestuariibacter salexigens]|uniref:succinylglutamate desuccinylase n=1 Tax=Aestuariibacter salexigens TaxID=226010 RepID=UPI0003FFB4C6|nr:succinylglutamate desuccinylase [Aestuariibacter salexigens]
MYQQLQDGAANFLHLSRTAPQHFTTPLTFSLTNNTRVTISAPGIICFEPAQPGDKDIVLSCGVHGNETAPIEICDELVTDLLTERLACQHRFLVQFGNLSAMDIGERFVEENMNRLFSGAHSQGPGLINEERKRAKLLEQSVAEFFTAAPASERHRAHYDLHTAIRDSKNEKFAVYPFTHGKPHNKQQLLFLKACGVTTILLSESPTTTYSYYSARQFNAHGFTVELGKVRPFGQNDMSRFAQARDSLRKLVSGEQLSLGEYRNEDFLIYRVNQVINRNEEDFRLNFADDVPNFTDFKKGTLLAEESGCRYIAEQDGEAIVFPNAKVAIGQRALLTVLPTTLD